MIELSGPKGRLNSMKKILKVSMGEPNLSKDIKSENYGKY